MTQQQNSLRLSKGTSFVRSRLERIPQANEAGEADFRALPKPMMQTETHFLGLVVVKKGGAVVAETQVEGSPSTSDLAALLGHAMRRPQTKDARRPRRILVRKNPRWKELFPALEELGIEVIVQSDLPGIKAASQERLQQMQEARRAQMVKPTPEQAKVEGMFPAIAQWVRDGHIEIGDQEGFGFVTQALDCGGLAFEDDRPKTLAEAMAALEKGLRQWFIEQGIELSSRGTKAPRRKP
jgi:signal recognition particle subunit SEC65